MASWSRANVHGSGAVDFRCFVLTQGADGAGIRMSVAVAFELDVCARPSVHGTGRDGMGRGFALEQGSRSRDPATS